ncbi:MAG: hypothetical protein AAB971_00625 [Patescibacteria group bacterium]
MSIEVVKSGEEVKLSDSLASIRIAITPLYEKVAPFLDGDVTDPQTLTEQLDDPAITLLHDRVLEVVAEVPREHLIEAARHAIDDRRADFEGMGEHAQGAIAFREKFLLAQLTEAERVDLLANQVH